MSLCDRDKLKVMYYPFSVIPSAVLKSLALYFDEVVVHVDTHFDPEELEFVSEGSFADAVAEHIPHAADDPDNLGILGDGFDSLMAWLVGRWGVRSFLADTAPLQQEGLLTIESRSILPAAVAAALKEEFAIPDLRVFLQQFDVHGQRTLIKSQIVAYSWYTRLLMSEEEGTDRLSLEDPESDEFAAGLMSFEYITAWGIAEQYGAIPLASSDIANDAMSFLANHYHQRAGDSYTAEAFPHEVAIALIQTALPNLQLATYEQVLEIREFAEPELLAFRSALVEASRELKLRTPNATTGDLVGPLQHALSTLERKISSARKRLIRSTLQACLSAAPPVLVTTAMPSLPSSALLSLSGAVAAVGLAGAIDEYRSAIAEAEEQSRGVTFLYRAGQRLA